MIRIAGVLLIALGVVSAMAIFLHPFGIVIKGSIVEFWALYAICFIGGFYMFGMGSPSTSSGRVLTVASGIVLCIGLLSAAALLLDKLTLVNASNTFSLWLLFILSTVVGVVGLLTAENAKGDLPGQSG